MKRKRRKKGGNSPISLFIILQHISYDRCLPFFLVKRGVGIEQIYLSFAFNQTKKQHNKKTCAGRANFQHIIGTEKSVSIFKLRNEI
jgi:hypothetical protein